MPGNVGIGNGEKIWQMSEEKEELMVGFPDPRKKKGRVIKLSNSFLLG
jgi:hypothetical protein